MYFHTILLGDGQTGNGVQATRNKSAKSQPADEDCQSNNVGNEIELELIWLGKIMHCLRRVLNFNST
jgi:hypothetical protein